MSKRIVSGITLTLLLIGMLTLAFNIQSVKASGTIYIRADGSVDPDTAPISTVDNVTYTLNANINDSIVVERSNIIIDGKGYTLEGSGIGRGISLTNINNVTILGTNIRGFNTGIYLLGSLNNSISGNNATNNNLGIWLDYFSNNNTISQNTVANNDYGGIYLKGSSNNTLSGNTASFNGDYYYGFNLQNSSGNIVVGNIAFNNKMGINIVDSSNNTIVRNTFTNNMWGSQLYNSSRNRAIENMVSNNSQYGIYIRYSSNNTIVGNTYINNSIYGIWLYESSNNTLYHNHFINNTEQILLGAISKNSWDNGYPSGGNCWSDYNGTDSYSGPYQNETGIDRIGDTPYIIDENNTDTYPLMGPWTNEGENVTVTPSAEVDITFENVTVGGITTVNSSETGPDPPLGYELAGQYYDIETTASYSGNITIRIVYDDSNMTQEQEENLQLMQWNETAQEWLDITTYIDTENNVIIGETSHLSMFGVTRALELVNYITITEVTPSKTIVGEGYSVTINVTIANLGDMLQTFNVTVYANANAIDSKNVTLASGNYTIITLTWNTTDWAKGNYTTSAYVKPVPGETDTADNTKYASEEVCVTIPGDVDADFDVDLYDAVKLLFRYGYKKGDLYYDPNCDINCDGKIDLFDAVILCTHYGQKDP